MPVVVRRRLVLRAATVAGLVAAFLAAGVAGALTALAVDDASRPDARVTHGPSCRPGGVVIEVTAGTEPYAARLTTTRRPAGEDSAELHPGAVAVLSTDDVDWGETIDARVEYIALDGSDTGFVDDLDGYSFTRPAEEDCATISPPADAAQVPPAGDPGGLPPAGGLPAPGVEPAPGTDGSGTAGAASGTAPQPGAGSGTGWVLISAGFTLLAGGAALAGVAARRGHHPGAGTLPESA